MSKTLGTILTVVAIGVAIASGVGALAAGTAALISAGIAAAQFVNSAVLASRAKDALQKRQASVAALQLGEVTREGIFGEVLTGGSLVDAFNWGGQWGTDWECRIIALADHLCDGLTGFYVNDSFEKYTGDGAVPGYNGQLEVYWRAGDVVQTVPQVVLANAPGWTANDFGSGVAWVAVCYKADKADAKNPVWPGGRPGFSWVVRGKRCYQARKDSTAGGSGTHRWSDPSTWEWTDNPIDCRYNWVRGIYAGDRLGDPDMLLVGRGLSAEEAPPANVFGPANVCDEQVAIDAGGSEKRYRLNGLVRADETYIEVEDHFAAACAGVILQPEGAVEIEPGQAKAPSFFFSDEDLLVGSSVEFSDELSEADNGWVNTVAPRYVEPKLKYADHAAPIRRVVADVLADGGPREQPLSLTMVTSSTQAGRVGEIARRMGRLRRRGKVTLGPAFAEVEEGDWGVWTSERYLKGKSVLFRVEAYALDEKWHNTLTLREISRDVYAKDADAASTAVAIRQDAPSIGAPGAGAWTAAPIVTGSNGRSMPAIAVTGLVDSDYAALIRFEYCVTDAGGPPANARWIEAGFAGPDARRFEITGVAASTSYAVAVSYVVGRVPGARRVLPTVTTMAASVGWTDISDPNGTRPANNATNSADPNSPFGNGRVRDAVAKLDRIVPLTEAVDLLAKGRIDADGLQRQATRDGARLREAVLRGILEADKTRTVMRDAGITVDPATGRVFIAAIDTLSGRTSRVEIELDATKTLIGLSASRDYVNEKIALAKLDATGKAALDEVLLRLTRAEVRLDGDQALISLKADATTVTQLTGRVATVRQDLDALAGVVSTKAETSVVDKLGTKVSVVEQRLGQIGDTTGYSIDIRQARYQADAAAENALKAIIGSDDLNRRQLRAAAQVREELYTRLVDGDAAEAAARTLLSVRLGTAEAAAAQETLARVEQGKALAQATSALEAKLGQDIAATVRTLTKTITDGDQASATGITQLGARLDSFGGVTIEQSFKALVDRTGKIEARAALAVDAGGNLFGWQLIGSNQGAASFNLINTDLRMGTGRVIFNNGSAMQVQGVGFGVNHDLIEWFGPTMAVERCSRANGVAWKATDGSAYFGGGLSAGVLYTSTSNPSLQADAVAVLGPYGTNGRKKIVVASYAFSRTARMTSAWSSTGTPSATLSFERLIGSGTWAKVQTLTAQGQVDRTSGYATEDEPDIFRESMSGAVTITDTSDPSADRQYRLRLTSRSQASLSGTHTTRDQTTQRLFISSTEE